MVEESVQSHELDEAWAASVLPRRTEKTHKWDVGGVVIVAGSQSFAGAAALCCVGAARAGAGIVSAALPRSIAHIVVGLVPEVTVVMLAEGESTSAGKRSADDILERLQRSRALVAGPGLGDDEATDVLLSALFGWSRARSGIGFGAGPAGSSGAAGALRAELDQPVVLDADALNWLAGRDEWWERLPRGRAVLTPHAGEMARLTRMSVDAVLADPERIARDSATRWGQTIVLKAGITVVASPDGKLASIEADRALATAGSGDVLSGAIGAFLAQGMDAFAAAALAVYVGNRAAQNLVARLGTLGVISSDLPLAMAEVMGQLERQGATGG
jgi:NAD(P)H-hydrate repair Nnr-like enzyme with NAD(P)H-hydrate dehydratase domain